MGRLRAAVVQAHGRVCWLCGAYIEGVVSVDHVVPRSRGGGDELANLRPAHLACNVARGDGVTRTRRPDPRPGASRTW